MELPYHHHQLDNPTIVLVWPKSSFGFQVKIKDTFFIVTKDFIE